ncbi:lytic murein transglycosylase [Nitratireductor indicus]|uniref:Lytic murein transglycosylase n=1 Tax=Nitratireductor indicus C115 TaxID=1231190 RepID=K2N2W3_9HYPH|nr:lytic transglycosylase domain-containing protein [Nitratireductor indicus]EKF41758.1 lytic murein transglycosylase [Nitratireductor indicus C115]MDS1136961.1 lytic transglycosylase domain-containing protein [Nitratireductor indicus]SFQ67634.1 lytic murein transglycosylase [Nitratireductor indicus]
MAFGGRAVLLAATVCASLLAAGTASAAQCGKTAAGFEAWKADFSRQAASRGIGKRGLSALAGTSYATKTIAADRGQKSFKLSLNAFMQKRGANAIVSRGKGMKKKYARLFDNLERRYGVPAGPLIAIWGMETGFGGFTGNQNILSAVTTLAYDCRRSEFFTGHLYAALQMVDRGMLSTSAKGAAHGEIGQTQFLPGNALKYAVDGDGNGSVDMIRSSADALASTANFLRAHGWRAGAGYQPGQPNFRAIQGWNAASVYQQAIAIMGKQIDE